MDYNVIATGLAAPAAVMIVKILLDFSLAQFFVKYFYWIPVRTIFRDNPQNLAGKWEQKWEAGGSATFLEPTDRHSYTDIKQFGRYLYAEFDSRGRTYCLFAKIRNGYVVGEWFDKKDRHAYFGAFQLRVVGSQTLSGRYIGHSQRTGDVGTDEWTWKKHE